MHRRLPNEELPNLGGLTLGDFWLWASSDILGNVNRGAFAEFLVAAALGLVDTPSVEWDDVDLRYGGHGIEVEAAAYLQTWPQAAPSIIHFDIASKRGWDPLTNTYPPQPVRSADCYIFCLFAETDLDRARQRVLDAAAREFCVVPTKRLDLELKDQKSVGLKAVRKMAPVVPYRDLKHQVELAPGLEG